MFVAMLRRKAVSAGGAVNEYSTRNTRHSQLCHGCGTLEKKPLSQRWHVCDCGIVAQRDLYSAFLAFCMEGATFNADYAHEAWSGADTRLRAALKVTQQPKLAGVCPPASA
ncbi:MAG: transposase [Anaerolineaceae bacterium]|nr:transposase [Anaerolineaceae bacterium]